ncbi:MAG TPA: ABC transporter permease, partial [Planctomycetota bacterium]|nr:ABC transporter permease [Planctomycetota bacterium]
AFFFYRFETCVREATVLGMLGVVSLGYHIREMRARQFYDEMLVLVVLGGLLVLAADLVSGLLRHRLRRG